ncbi:hypothetical protein GCM10010156_16600 [Planobispora rosea]|uniref:ABC transporter permease n=1 Tax=Planobispora rosea TaxID=35762 RepID=A0A8J3RX61_PLARO|nr:hypothetical protein [Planobispora rosea]GGS58612.1 hypothetical protein GCM10010156_16600 [Planobispora rosea]GIH84731.1 hypothetical protein Pro02_31390 [Planobispora rosea]
MSAFSAALRISRRDARRARGRSALIITMIGLPVLVITLFLILMETMSISSTEGVTAELGTADARIRETYTRGEVYQDVEGRDWAAPAEPGGPARSRTAAEVAALLGAGTRLVPIGQGSVEVRNGGGYDHVSAHEVDLRDPLTAGMYRLVEGRLPASPQEVAVTPGMRELGARIGGTLTVTRQDRPVRVVGVVGHPHHLDGREMVGLPGTLFPDRRDDEADWSIRAGWLADTPQPVTWDVVRRLNAAGLTAFSRAVVADPPASTAPYAAESDVDRIGTVVLIGVMIVLEVVLLAGPAFLVGLRRRRRELALIAAQDGSPGHLRMVVLADGLVLGGGAALLGLVLSLGLAGLAVVFEAGRLVGRAGPFDIPVVPVAAVTSLGLLSGLAAAVVPAVQAGRQDVAAVLGGRRGEARDRAGRPVLGVILLAAGVGATFFAVRLDVVWVSAAAVLSQLGLIALTPRLVRAAAGLAARLPLPFRLAARDASRHRARTASAVAAVMTATAAFTAAGVAINSNFADNRDSFQTTVPAGTLVITGSELDDGEWAEVTEAVRERLPGVPLIEAAEGRDARGRIMGTRIRGGGPGMPGVDSLPIGDSRLLRLIQGRPDPVAAEAFAAGKAVVFNPALVRDGRLAVTLFPRHRGEDHKEVTFPAVVAEAADPRHAVAVLPASALRTVGLTAVVRSLYVDPAAHRIGIDQLSRFHREVDAVNKETSTYVERGFDDGYLAPQMWVLLGAALVLVLGGTFVATGLAAADLRPDLATMASVGAPPGTRRLVVAGQAGFIAGLGVLVGALAGVVTGIGAAWHMTVQEYSHTFVLLRGGLPPFPDGEPTVELPWLFLAVIVIGLPVLAAAVAGLFARTRVTLTRRMT